MNFADDEDEDSTNIGITRYPCMPSLVALQQMRNRLHLARLGKKLMKWTALATGKELRKTSAEIIEVMDGFPEKISNAYILLARCRYFYPSLNEIVINNIPKEASVIVERSYRSASGIKLLIFTVEETGVVPYPHLGIGQGGETVKEAKAAWLELLKQMILLLQLREDFITIEGANKGATKRMNVLNKLVIPKIQITIKYILLELEELEREEFARLKKVQKAKKKLIQQKNNEDDSDDVSKIDKKKSSVTFKYVEPTSSKTEVNKESVLQEFSELLKVNDSLVRTGVSTAAINVILNLLDDLKAVAGNFFMDFLSELSTKIDKEYTFEEGTETVLKEEEMKIEVTAEDKIKNHLYDLRKHLHNISDKLLNEPAQSVQDFATACDNIKNKITDYLNKVDVDFDSVSTESRFAYLKSRITEAEHLAEEYKTEGLLSSSADAFIKSCEQAKSKIDSYAKRQVEDEKLRRLKEQVTGIEKLTTNVKEDGIATKSIDNFLDSCKEFRCKLEQCESKNMKPPTEGSVQNLVNKLNDTIELSKEVDKKGLVEGGLEKFLRSCEDLKRQILSTVNYPSLQKLKSNISEVIEIVEGLKSQGLITASIEEFINTCEATKRTIESETYPEEEEVESLILYGNYSESCMCSKELSLMDLSYEKITTKREKVADEKFLPSPPCEFCKKIVGALQPGEPFNEYTKDPCKSCKSEKNIPNKNEVVPEEDMQKYVSPEHEKSITTLCDLCTTVSKEGLSKICCETPKEFTHELEEEEVPISSSELIDNSLGYFERKIRTITKLKRQKKNDGTVEETQEVITIIKEKTDPSRTTMECCDDDDDDDLIMSIQLNEPK